MKKVLLVADFGFGEVVVKKERAVVTWWVEGFVVDLTVVEVLDHLA